MPRITSWTYCASSNARPCRSRWANSPSSYAQRNRSTAPQPVCSGLVRTSAPVDDDATLQPKIILTRVVEEIVAESGIKILGLDGT